LHISEKIPFLAAPVRTVASVQFRMRMAGVLLLLFALALLPRIVATGDFWTPDEAKHWSVRAEKFVEAMREGAYADTNLVGHPGVTTMWLGAAGVLTYETLAAQGYVVPADPALEHILDSDYGSAAEVYSAAPADFALYRWLLRLPVSLVTALGVAFSSLLLHRLLGNPLALLAAVLLATDPFLVAHGRTLHVDALLTTFMLLALLTAMLAFRLDLESADEGQGVRWRWLLLSALFGGLALLTKSPSVFLLPMIGLLAFIHSARLLRPAWGSRLVAWALRALVRALGVLLLWLGIAALLWVALWPAAWLDPFGALMTVVAEVLRNGAQPHSWGNFYMGQVVADPGPLYYAVAIVLRLTPWVMIGMLATGGAVLVAVLRRRIAWLDRLPPAPGLQPGTPALRVVGLLVIFALLFIIIMSNPAKKFDRYVLPVFPVLIIVAAPGLLWLAALLAHPFQQRERATRQAAPALAIALLLLISVVNLAWYHPYQMAYYNPLVGGAPVAVRSIYVGWGEGLEQAGGYIKAQPNGCDYAVGAWYELVILPYVCSPVMELNWAYVPGKMDYVVFYINQLQRNIKADVTRMVMQQGSLVHTVRIHGIEYAYVYQLPQPTEHRLAADFGERIRLVGYEVESGAVRESGVLTLTVQWQAQQQIQADYLLFVHVLDAQGNVVAQTDVPPAGPDLPTSAWHLNHYNRWFHPVRIPADVPAGTYWLALGLYHPHDFTRLPLQAAPPPPGAPDDGENALLLQPLTIPPAAGGTSHNP
jgi:4-amino-4-deoxy-L-arabinose transferase-like glycosyltransferase